MLEPDSHPRPWLTLGAFSDASPTFPYCFPLRVSHLGLVGGQWGMAELGERLSQVLQGPDLPGSQAICQKAVSWSVPCRSSSEHLICG